MSLVIAASKYARLGEGFSRRERLAADLHPGRRTDGTQSAAEWITQLADSTKIIVLCVFCQPKFNPRTNGYRRWYAPDWSGAVPDPNQVNGVCDACKVRVYQGGRGYVKEEFYHLINRDPVDARRQSRAAWRATSVWSAVRTYAARAWGSRAPAEGSA